MAIFDLPAYATILAQVFSPDGNLFVAGSESGKIALFKTKNLMSSGRGDEEGLIGTGVGETRSEEELCFFQFTIQSCLDEPVQCSRWAVTDLASTSDCLLASVSDLSRSHLLAFPWKLLERKRAQVSWKIQQAPLLPIDINSIVVDEQSSTMGQLYVGGGGPSVHQTSSKVDNSIRVIDVETGLQARSSMTGHENFIHSLTFDQNRLLSASEDGTARLWDPRTKSGQTNVIKPSDLDGLNRPKLGKWLGAASLSGDWFAVGGGPRAALWHLRTLSPMEPHLPPDQSNLESSNLGGVHMLKIVDEEQKIIVGGEFGGKLFMADMGSLQTVAEIPTSSGCTTYSVAYQMTPYKMMCVAGASSRIDLCTSNFSYKAKVFSLPSGSG